MNISLRAAALLAAGGALGTLARYGVSRLLPTPAGAFALSTLMVNLAGSFLLGMALGWAVPHHPAAGDVRLALAVGFCGAFTTMSTFAFDTVSMAQHHAWGSAGLYVTASLLGSIAAVVAGLLIGTRFA